MASLGTSSGTISSKLKRKCASDAGTATDKSCKKALRSAAAHSTVIDINKRLKEIQGLSDSYPLATNILEMETKYTDTLMKLDFGDKITHVYNPVDYAYKPHVEYYRKFCRNTVKVVLIGENPGPFGGAQNGVPFGDMRSVTEWLQIKEDVACPDRQHVKRPIRGFDTTRSEGSGSRLWGFIRQHFATADEFFDTCFIYNYCPMIFMNHSGGNVTPSQMQAAVKKPLLEVCDKALGDLIALFPNCTRIVGIGRFAEQRIKDVCTARNFPHQQSYLLHPSPRSPAAAQNWDSTALQSFREFGLIPS